MILYRATLEERQQMQAIKDEYGIPFQAQIKHALQIYLMNAEVGEDDAGRGRHRKTADARRGR